MALRMTCYAVERSGVEPRTLFRRLCRQEDADDAALEVWPESFKDLSSLCAFGLDTAFARVTSWDFARGSLADDVRERLTSAPPTDERVTLKVRYELLTKTTDPWRVLDKKGLPPAEMVLAVGVDLRKPGVTFGIGLDDECPSSLPTVGPRYDRRALLDRDAVRHWCKTRFQEFLSERLPRIGSSAQLDFERSNLIREATPDVREEDAGYGFGSRDSGYMRHSVCVERARDGLVEAAVAALEGFSATRVVSTYEGPASGAVARQRWLKTPRWITMPAWWGTFRVRGPHPKMTVGHARLAVEIAVPMDGVPIKVALLLYCGKQPRVVVGCRGGRLPPRLKTQLERTWRVRLSRAEAVDYPW